jgi:hypothetical protein
MTDSPGFANPAEQVSAVRKEMLRVARDDPGRWWTGDELRQAVQNGYPSTVVNIALNDLVASDDLRLNNRLLIQYAG